MSKAQKLADQINALSPPDKLRLCAELLENRKAETAHRILERVTLELGAALALSKTRKGGAR